MDQRRIPRLCFWLTAVLALLGVSLRTVCMLCFFDADVGYFQSGILPAISSALYFAAVAAAILCAALTPKGTLPAELQVQGRPYAALFAGLALGGFTVAALLFPSLFAGVSGKITLAANLAGLPSALYFFCSAHKQGKYPDWLSLLGFIPAIWSILAIADTYFDAYVALNSPIKTALHLGLLGLMLMLLAELRFRVGKPLPRYSLAFLSVGSYTCLVGSIPLLIAAAAGSVTLPRYSLYAAVLTIMGLYGLYLLLHYTASPIPAEVTDITADTPNQNEE